MSAGVATLNELEPPYGRSLRIKDLPAAGRPRERLLAVGPAALSEAELVAILLGTGDGERSALGLAETLLARLAEPQDPSGLRGLSGARPDELMNLPGVGPAKAARLMAGLELGRRASTVHPAERTVINGPQDAYRLLSGRLARLDREHFVAVLVDAKHQVIAYEPIAVGTLNATLVHPRELFKEAIRRSAAGMVLGHNHPSGDPTPSPEDRALTAQLMAGAEILGIRILDHLVIGEGRFVSLRETTPLWNEHPFHM